MASLPLGELLLEIDEAALDLVQSVEGALLVALGGEAHCPPVRRSGLVGRGLGLHRRLEHEARGAEEERVLDHLLQVARGRALPRIEALLPHLPAQHDLLLTAPGGAPRPPW